MQMALNSAQAVRSGFQEFKYGFYDIVRKTWAKDTNTCSHYLST